MTFWGIGYSHHIPDFLLSTPFSPSWLFLQNIWTQEGPSLCYCRVEGEVGMCVLLWEEGGTIPGNSMRLESDSSAAVPACSASLLWGQSSWAVIQHSQRAAFIPPFFRNFSLFLNHWQGRGVYSSGQGGACEGNEILWFDKNI